MKNLAFTTDVHLSESTASDPFRFRSWLGALRQAGWTPLTIAQALPEQLGPAGQVRRAALYEQGGEATLALQLAGSAVMDNNVVIRALGFALLSRNDTAAVLQECARGARSDARSAAAPALASVLRDLRTSPSNGGLALEATVSILIALAEQHIEAGDIQHALERASEAVLSAQALGVDSLLRAARLAYATCAFRADRFADALLQYSLVSEDPQVGARQALHARTNMALILNRFGNDEGAIALLDMVRRDHPDDPAVRVTHQFILAWLGILPEGAPIQECPSNSYDRVTLALRLLEPQQDRSAQDALDVLAILREWRPQSASLRGLLPWLQGVAHLRLNEPLLAARRIQGAPAGVPDQQALLLALQLDIAFHPGGHGTFCPATVCRHMRQLFERLPDQAARLGLARRLARWHPTAAAFLACAPEPVLECVDVAIGSVFRDGRPILVQGTRVSTRLVFVQRTLEAFGIDANVPRDQSEEYRRLHLALREDVQGVTRRRHVVPPAVLAYHLKRMDGTGQGAWTRCAQEVAAAYGLVPRTEGAYLREQRGALQDLLSRFLEGNLPPDDAHDELQRLRSLK